MGKKTEDIPKNDRSRRFLEVINKLQSINKISDSQLSREISGNEKNKDLVNKIRKGITEPQYEDVEIFSTLYNVNKDYILSDSPQMFAEKEAQDTLFSKEEIKKIIAKNMQLNDELQHFLKEDNKNLNKIIELRDKISELEKLIPPKQA